MSLFMPRFRLFLGQRTYIQYTNRMYIQYTNRMYIQYTNRM